MNVFLLLLNFLKRWKFLFFLIFLLYCLFLSHKTIFPLYFKIHLFLFFNLYCNIILFGNFFVLRVILNRLQFTTQLRNQILRYLYVLIPTLLLFLSLNLFLISLYGTKIRLNRLKWIFLFLISSFFSWCMFK